MNSPLSTSEKRLGQVLVVGDVMDDVIVKPEGPMVRGSDRRASVRHLPGGAGANQATWLAHFGVKVGLLAKVGNSDLEHYTTLLQRRGIRPWLTTDRILPTGSLVAIIDADGERSFFSDRGANMMLDPDDLRSDLLDEVGLLHISGYALFAPRSRATVQELMRQAQERAIRWTVDPASTGFLTEVGPAEFLNWTNGAAFCFANEAEAALLAGSPDPAMQAVVLARHYDHVVIKRGGRGAELFGRDGVCLATLPAPPVEVLDTTGAGDAFLAAFLAGYLERRPLEACLAQGITAGAEATTFFGAQPPG
jgi:sugar/nucleoside kinase (ribokinase family)